MESKNKIKVLGIGGGGCNIIESIKKPGENIVFACCDVKPERLAVRTAENIFALSALEDTDGYDMTEVMDFLKDGDIAVLIACLGGRSSKLIQEIAKQTKDAGVITVDVVTLPFKFEGNKRNSMAETTVANLKEISESVAVLDNNSLKKYYSDKSLLYGFDRIDRLAEHAIDKIVAHIDKYGVPSITTLEWDVIIDAFIRKDTRHGSTSWWSRLKNAFYELILPIK